MPIVGQTGSIVSEKDLPGSGGGSVNSVVAGTNISVNNTDPANPIVSSLSDRYKTTSSTSNTMVSTGSLTFTVDANLSYTALQEVVIVHNSSNHMHGAVTAYSGTTLTVDVKHRTGSGTYSSWTINLDGTPVDALTGSGTIGQLATFTGSQVLGSTAVKTVNGESIIGSGDIVIGGAVLAIVERNLGSVPKKAGRFTITSSGLTIGKPVSIQQAVGPYTGKGTRADEAEMDGIVVNAIVTASNTITAYWNSATRVKGNVKFNYFVGA